VTAGKQFGPWQVVRSLGKGGQGEVFLVEREANGVDLSKLLSQALVISRRTVAPDQSEAARLILNIITAVAQGPKPLLGALKLLHPGDSELATAKNLERMKKEIEILARCSHPSLTRLLDQKLDDGWFVMEYFANGPLTHHLQRTRGDMLGTLLTFRPLVDAVVALHDAGAVHRDIKPDNIYVADDDRLVLGDCGLVIESEQRDRITDTYENVGSRDWMPGWAMGMRISQVRPSFDVFCLGKVLWSMLSGKPRLRLWYLHAPEFELEEMFKANRAVWWARRILDKCVVEHEAQCLPSARDLLAETDAVIAALSKQGQVLRKTQPIQCVICGLGEYREIFGTEQQRFACTACGNVQLFTGVTGPAWQA
jgi:serine/threonine protein kinase